MNRCISFSVVALLVTTALLCAKDDGVVAPAVASTVAVPSGSASNSAGASEPSAAGAEDVGIRLPLPPVGNPLAAARIDKRMFGVIPNHRAEQETADYKPLKTWEKFKIAERDTFDWPNFPLMAGFALQTQIAQNGWHGRAMGKNFAEYYARSFGDAFIGNFLTEAVMPSLLHEDPRFFRSGVGPVWKRAFKAARQVMVTRTENGGSRFNFSEVLGNSAVVAVTSIYYPESRRFGPAAQRVGLQIGNDVIANMLTEFWPDVKRRIQPMLHRHHTVDD